MSCRPCEIVTRGLVPCSPLGIVTDGYLSCAGRGAAAPLPGEEKEPGKRKFKYIVIPAAAAEAALEESNIELDVEPLEFDVQDMPVSESAPALQDMSWLDQELARILRADAIREHAQLEAERAAEALRLEEEIALLMVMMTDE